MDQHTGPFTAGEERIQSPDPQSIDILQLAGKERFQLRLADDAFPCDEMPNAFVPVPMTPEPTAGAAGFPTGGGQRGAVLGVLCSVKNPYAQIEDAVGIAVSVQRDCCPAHRCNADIQTNAVAAHGSTSFPNKEITP